jgi:hypothetical protein
MRLNGREIVVNCTVAQGVKGQVFRLVVQGSISPDSKLLSLP